MSNPVYLYEGTAVQADGRQLRVSTHAKDNTEATRLLQAQYSGCQIVAVRRVS